MMIKGLVSCIVTTYRRPVSVLKRALDSIMNQTYQNTEVILINDDPQEEKLNKQIEKLLQSYQKKVRYIVLLEHQGACGARNAGLKEASGEYVAFLDDDDEWLPQKLEIQMTYMKKEDVALVYSSHYFVTAKGKRRKIEEPLAGKGMKGEEFKYLLRANFIGSTSSPLIRKQAVEAVGGFDRSLKSSQDHDLWLQIAREYRICYLKEPLVILYYSKDAISRSKKRVLQGYECLLNKYALYYESDKSTYNYRLNYLALYCISLGYGREFLHYWGRAIRVKGFSVYNFMILGRACRKIRYVLGDGE